MKTMLKLENVCKSFGGVVTADHVDMTVYAGEVHGLIGPNGAGKTTMLNLISGIYDVDDGKIFFDNQEITNMHPHNRARMGLGRTFQVPRFLQRSSIRDNLMLGVDLADQFGFLKSFLGAKGESLDDELHLLMEIAGFTFDWREQITSLPFGKQKLMEIIRAMLTKPKLMLVDEPAAGLNRKEIGNAIALLNLAAKERGISVVLIEHAMDMIMDVCDQITVINFGKVIGEGTPDEVSSNEDVITAYLGRDVNA